MLLYEINKCDRVDTIDSAKFKTPIIMKKLILSLFAFSFFTAVSAQTFRIGPTIDGNLNLAQDTKVRVGFAVGVKGEVNFSSTGHGWFMNTAVLFNNRNLCSESYYDLNTRNSYQWKYATYSLNIPINVGYKIQVSHKLNLLVAVGPYIDFGLTGNDKLFTTDEKGHESKKRINAGMNVSVGTEFARHYQISLSYSRSFTNLFKDDSHVKTQDLLLGFTYMF